MKGKRVWEIGAVVLLLICVAAAVGGFAYYQRLNRDLASTLEALTDVEVEPEPLLDRARRLLRAGGSIQTRDHTGGTLLMAAAQWNDPALVRLALDRGAPVAAANARGDTALTLAAAYGNTEVVRELLAAGAPVDAKNEAGQTPLFVAAAFDEIDDASVIAAARLLVEHGANVNVVDSGGHSALWHALETQKWGVARLLKAHGARR